MHVANGAPSGKRDWQQRALKINPNISTVVCQGERHRRVSYDFGQMQRSNVHLMVHKCSRCTKHDALGLLIHSNSQRNMPWLEVHCTCTCNVLENASSNASAYRQMQRKVCGEMLSSISLTHPCSFFHLAPLKPMQD